MFFLETKFYFLSKILKQKLNVLQQYSQYCIGNDFKQTVLNLRLCNFVKKVLTKKEVFYK